MTSRTPPTSAADAYTELEQRIAAMSLRQQALEMQCEQLRAQVVTLTAASQIHQ